MMGPEAYRTLLNSACDASSIARGAHWIQSHACVEDNRVSLFRSPAIATAIVSGSDRQSLISMLYVCSSLHVRTDPQDHVTEHVRRDRFVGLHNSTTCSTASAAGRWLCQILDSINLLGSTGASVFECEELGSSPVCFSVN
nr:hypothetical protein CFP56_23944 [Quercus suber]